MFKARSLPNPNPKTGLLIPGESPVNYPLYQIFKASRFLSFFSMKHQKSSTPFQPGGQLGQRRCPYCRDASRARKYGEKHPSFPSRMPVSPSWSPHLLNLLAEAPGNVFVGISTPRVQSRAGKGLKAKRLTTCTSRSRIQRCNTTGQLWGWGSQGKEGRRQEDSRAHPTERPVTHPLQWRLGRAEEHHAVSFGHCSVRCKASRQLEGRVWLSTGPARDDQPSDTKKSETQPRML